jgi:hypothetical protein
MWNQITVTDSKEWVLDMEIDAEKLKGFLLSIESGTEGMCPSCRDMQENYYMDNTVRYIRRQIPFPDGRLFKHTEDCEWLEIWMMVRGIDSTGGS